MDKNYVLSIRGRQAYQDQEPDVIELVTEGSLSWQDGGWDVVYEETELTGMAGVTTTFRVEPGCITLTRSGKLSSQMIFREGICHDSLYQLEFGALLMTICARKVHYDLTEQGGTIDLTYTIDIENTSAGVIDYHLDIQKK